MLKMERAVFEGLGDFRSEAVGLEYSSSPARNRESSYRILPPEQSATNRDELARKFVLGQHKAARQEPARRCN